MSRRTAEANKAIRLAWENERALVAEGKGTRDWTEEQQKDIIEKGKAYDDSGRAFEGQHMKSAEEYPKYQGDPGNIQFLTREEHLAAHRGNWQNPTNWHYDPVTKKMSDFGEDKYIPCNVIELRKPIAITISKTNSTINNTISNKTQQQETAHNKVIDKPQVHSSLKDKGTKTSKLSVAGKHVPKGKIGVFKYLAKKAYDYKEILIPTLITIVKIAVDIYEKAKNGDSSGLNSNGNNNRTNNNDTNTLDNGENMDDIDLYSDDENDIVDDNLETSRRSSPCEHEVKGHSQLYHTKNGDVRKEKAPYPRGGKKEDDVDSKQ